MMRISWSAVVSTEANYVRIEGEEGEALGIGTQFPRGSCVPELRVTI